MSKKILPLILATGFALLFNACGSDGDSVSGITCEEGDCFEESSSSVSDEDNSSSSVKTENKSSSSSIQKESSCSESEKSSSSLAASSSSAKTESSSSEKLESSSSEAPESSSSVKINYLNTTPNLADLEVSGDTLFAIFQRQSADYSIPTVGLLALYNRESGELLDTISLATKNPYTVKVAGGFAYVATAGEYDAATWSLPADANRGIEKVDLQKKSSSLFVSGTKLGGGAQNFVVNKNGDKGYVSVYKSLNNTIVVEIDFSTGFVKEINGIKDASGSLEYDNENGLLYIGDRFLDYKTYEMHISVFTYDGTKLDSLTDPESEGRQPYSIKVVNGHPYVFVSDYNSGKLYIDYADGEKDGVQYFQDSKLATANGKLYLIEGNTKAATIAQINLATGTPVWQKALEAGANPYDVVAAGNENLWVAFYGLPKIQKISADGAAISAIDTKEFCAYTIE